jgi:hypothetical protein
MGLLLAPLLVYSPDLPEAARTALVESRLADAAMVLMRAFDLEWNEVSQLVGMPFIVAD